jgi:ribonuclease E
MVQTSAASVAMAPAEPPVKLGRPRKQKPVDETADNEPLVMVETGK